MERKVTDKEKKTMEKIAEDLIKKRGEVIHWMTEIESELDELIVHNFIVDNEKPHFFEILLWEDFPFRTKRRLFQEINVSEKLKDFQKEISNSLERLGSIRNKFGHRLSLITLKESYLIDKGHKPYKIDKEMFKSFKDKAIETLAKLRYLLLIQKGIKPSNISKDSYWINIKDIKE